MAKKLAGINENETAEIANKLVLCANESYRRKI
jgi:hypothetical protein